MNKDIYIWDVDSIEVIYIHMIGSTILNDSLMILSFALIIDE